MGRENGSPRLACSRPSVVRTPEAVQVRAERAGGTGRRATSLRHCQARNHAPVTSWSNLLARKWPREYALAKQAAGFKCTAQKVREAIDANLLNRYGSVWQWRGGWPAEAEKYPACSI